MIDVIYFGISLYTCFCFYSKKYIKFIVSYFTLIFYVWGLLPGPNVVMIYDYVNLVTFISVFIGLTKNSLFLSIKDDFIGKIILFLLLYSFFMSVISPLRIPVSLTHSLMVFRFDLYYLLYFVFRQIPRQQIEKSIYILIKCTLFGLFLYYLQFAGISLYNSDDFTEGSRFANTPVLTTFAYLYFLLKSKNNWKYLFGVFITLSAIILSQTRGLLLGILVSTIFVFLFKREMLNRKIFIVITVSFLFFSSILLYRFSEDGSTGGGIKEEIENVAELLQYKDFYNYSDNSVMFTKGTFFFRIGMVLEKHYYITQNPIRFVFGAGAYHEDSPSTKKLPFNLGSHAGDYIAMVDTADISFLSRYFRFGLFYLVIVFFLYAKCLNYYLRENSFNSLIAFLLLLSFIFTSIGQDCCDNPVKFSIMLLLFSLNSPYGMTIHKLSKT